MSAPFLISPLAGKPIDPARLIDVAQLIGAYFSGAPDPSRPSERVHFGTSGHRGSAFSNSFNEPHVLAIAQAICLYRARADIRGPLFLGIDTHALSRPALATVPFTPTPVSTLEIWLLPLGTPRLGPPALERSSAESASQGP